jgi:hypothetical protein
MRINDNRLTVFGLVKNYIHKDIHNQIEPFALVLAHRNGLSLKELSRMFILIKFKNSFLVIVKIKALKVSEIPIF